MMKCTGELRHDIIQRAAVGVQGCDIVKLVSHS